MKPDLDLITQVKEPCVLVPCTDLIELIQCWDEKHGTFSNNPARRFGWYWRQANKAFRKFQRRTMRDS